MQGTSIEEKVEDITEYLLGEISQSYEPQWHIQVSFYTCAVPITWFSCVREFFHAAMGVLVGKKGTQVLNYVFTRVTGHYNGWKRRQVLHSDLSYSNIWM